MTLEQRKKKNPIPMIIGLVAALVAYFVFPQFSDDSVEDELQKIADQINETAPIQKGKIGSLDSCTLVGSSKFTYHYSVAVAKSDIELDSVKSSLEAEVMQSLLRSVYDPEMKVFRKNNVAVAFEFSDKNGE